MLSAGPISLTNRQAKHPLLQIMCLLVIFASGAIHASAQNTTPPCTLERRVYTCNGPAFQKQLAAAQTLSLETHSIDKFAQLQLRNLLIRRLNKTVVPEGSTSDLVFLILPLGGEGVNVNAGATEIGTLRVYSVGPNNARGDLLWAEVFSGQEDLPWPTVVNSLILQFRSHFHIK